MPQQSEGQVGQPLAGIGRVKVAREVHPVGDIRWIRSSPGAVKTIDCNMTLVQYTIGSSFA